MLGSKTRKAIVAVALVSIIVIAGAAFFSGGGGAQNDPTLKQPEHLWSNESDTWYFTEVDDRPNERYTYGSTGSGLVRYNITDETKAEISSWPTGDAFESFQALEDHPDTTSEQTALLFSNETHVTKAVANWSTESMETSLREELEADGGTISDTRQAVDYHPGPSDSHEGFVAITTRSNLESLENGSGVDSPLGNLFEWNLSTDVVDGDSVNVSPGHEMVAVEYPQSHYTPWNSSTGDRRMTAVSEAGGGGGVELFWILDPFTIEDDFRSGGVNDMMEGADTVADMETESSGFGAFILTEEGNIHSITSSGASDYQSTGPNWRAFEYVNDKHLFASERYATTVDHIDSVIGDPTPVTSFEHDVSQSPHSTDVGHTDYASTGFIGGEMWSVYNDLVGVTDIRINADSEFVAEGDTTTFTIEAVDSGGNVIDTLNPSDVVLTVEDESIASLNTQLGEDEVFLTGESLGETRVSANWMEFEDDETFTVVEDFLEEIDLRVDTENNEVGWGETVGYEVIGEMAGGDEITLTDQATVQSGNSSRLTVEGSYLVAGEPGGVNVNASFVTETPIPVDQQTDFVDSVSTSGGVESVDSTDDIVYAMDDDDNLNAWGVDGLSNVFTVNAPVPRFDPNALEIDRGSVFYSDTNGANRIDRFEGTQEWTNNEIADTDHTANTVSVSEDGTLVIFGVDGPAQGSPGLLYAFDAVSGTEQYHINNSAFVQNRVRDTRINDGILYTVTEGDIAAHDVDTGNELYVEPITNEARGMEYIDGELFVGNLSGFVNVYDADDGTLLETINTGASSGGSDLEYDAAGDVLFFSAQDGVYTIDPEERSWEHEYDSSGSFPSGVDSITVNDQYLIAGHPSGVDVWTKPYTTAESMLTDIESLTVLEPAPETLTLDIDENVPDYGASHGYTVTLEYEDGDTEDVTSFATLSSSATNLVTVNTMNQSLDVTIDESQSGRSTITAEYDDVQHGEFSTSQQMLIGEEPGLGDADFLGPGALLRILLTSTTVIWVVLSTAGAGYAALETAESLIGVAVFAGLMGVGWIISAMFTWTFVPTPILIGTVIVSGAVFYVREL